MEKDDKKAPEPKLYNKLHDRPIEDILNDFRALYHPDAREKFKKERGSVRRALKQRVMMHFAQHGIDDKTKMFLRHGYHDMDETMKRKWVEDFLHNYALDGISMHMGADAAKGYAQNLDLLRDYIEQHMTTDKLKDYEAIIEKLSSSKNLIDDFDEDPDLQELLETYVQKINSSARKSKDYMLHLQRIDYAPDVAKYANKIIGQYGMEFSPHTPISTYLDNIARSADPEFRPKKSKVLKELPKKKK